MLLEFPLTESKKVHASASSRSKPRSNAKKDRTLHQLKCLKQVVQIVLWVYYVEGLGHNLFFVSQFCDSDLEVTFRKHSCFVRDLDGVGHIKGSRDTNLYTIYVEDMMRSSPICLLSKASKNKSWYQLQLVQFVQTDNGTEFVNKNLTDFYESFGITHEKTVLRTPQQNGVVEQRNHTLVEAARTMLIFSKAPWFLWAEAMATAC
ncbi:integrase, catalytic region, zinc finger, CCHC-type containing protein [Tanacetum coccineum]